MNLEQLINYLQSKLKDGHIIVPCGIGKAYSCDKGLCFEEEENISVKDMYQNALMNVSYPFWVDMRGFEHEITKDTLVFIGDAVGDYYEISPLLLSYMLGEY